MKNTLFICLCLSALSAFAQAPNARPNLTPEEIAAHKAEMQERRMRYTGGLVVRPDSLKGEIVYVNCQKAADKAWLEESIAYFVKESKVNISLRDGVFDLKNPSVQGNLSIFIVEDSALPNLLIAPENRWAMVNVAPLKTEKTAFFAARVKKELSRAFALLCGGANSSFPNALTGGITKPADLDTHLDLRLQADIISRFHSYLKPFGVIPAVRTSYRKACMEGWAPEPADDYQKAIWDELHQLPTEPIKIKPEEKK